MGAADNQQLRSQMRRIFLDMRDDRISPPDVSTPVTGEEPPRRGVSIEATCSGFVVININAETLHIDGAALKALIEAAERLPAGDQSR